MIVCEYKEKKRELIKGLKIYKKQAKKKEREETKWS